MTLLLHTSFCVSLFLLCRVGPSFCDYPEDLEGSGYDLEDSGSGSGEWSHNEYDYFLKDVNVIGLSVMTNAKSQWPTEDSYVNLENSKSSLESKEIRYGVIAGGVTGAILAAVCAAVLICRFQKKDDEGYISGQRKASDEHYLKNNRDEVIV